MDLFPIKFTGSAHGLLALLIITVVVILNVALWFGITFVLAYAAAKGWAAGS